jgi:hypothetical protein
LGHFISQTGPKLRAGQDIDEWVDELVMAVNGKPNQKTSPKGEAEEG